MGFLPDDSSVRNNIPFGLQTFGHSVSFMGHFLGSVSDICLLRIYR